MESKVAACGGPDINFNGQDEDGDVDESNVIHDELEEGEADETSSAGSASPPHNIRIPPYTIPTDVNMVTTNNNMVSNKACTQFAPKPAPGFINTQRQHVPLRSNMYKMKLPKERKVYLYEAMVTDITTRREKIISKGSMDDYTRDKRKQLCYQILYKVLCEEKGSGQLASIRDVIYDCAKLIVSRKKFQLTPVGVEYEVSVTPSGERVDRKYRMCIKPGTPDVVDLTNVLDVADVSGKATRLEHQILELLTTQQLQYDRMKGKKGAYVPMNHNFYDMANEWTLEHDPDRVLVEGVSKSVRVVEGTDKEGPTAVLQLDRTTSAFYKEQLIIDYCRDTLNIPLSENMSDGEKRGIVRALKTIQCIAIHSMKPVQLGNVVGSADREKFKTADGEKLTVAEYFKSKYFKLKYPQYPCIDDRGTLYPIETLKIAPNQRVPISKQTGSQMAHMVKHAAVRPDVRLKRLTEALARANIQKNKFLDTFGVDVSEQTMVVNGRLLPMPRIIYNDDKNAKEVSGNAEWSMDNVKWLIGGYCRKWAAVTFVRGREDKQFIDNFGDAAKMSGIDMPSRPRRIEECREEEVASFFRRCKGREYDFVFSIIPDNAQSLHRSIKMAELKYDIQTQNIRQQTVRKVIGGRGGRQVMTNIVAKTNMKLGGVDHEIGFKQNDPSTFSASRWFDMDVMYIGVDVTHPPPQSAMERMKKIAPREPSVVGLVANTTGEMFGMTGQHWVQDPRVESVLDLQPHIEQLLLLYADKNSEKLPKYMMYFRDGVSEGQYQMVMQDEVPQIKAAYNKVASELGHDRVHIQMNTVVVVKRHHTRFFPEEVVEQVEREASSSGRDRSPPRHSRGDGRREYGREDRRDEGRSMEGGRGGGDFRGRGGFGGRGRGGSRGGGVPDNNVRPGTVVDTTVVHSQLFEFYVASHKALQGTVRPVKYVVLQNELKLDSDEMQAVCHTLTFGHGIVNKAIALPAPVRGADDMAKRGKDLIASLIACDQFGGSGEMDWASMSRAILIPRTHKIGQRKHWA